MWPWTGRRSGRLAEEVEMLRRKVDAVLYDQEDIKSRLQKVLWRIGKLSAQPVDEGSTPSASSGPTGLGASTSPSPQTDPVSARLLARRSRRTGTLPSLPPTGSREDERD